MFNLNSNSDHMKTKVVTIFALALFSMMLIAGSANAAEIASAKSGAWSADTTWVGGIVPSSSDNVSIAAGHVVTLKGSESSCHNLTLTGTNATVRFAIDGSVTNLTVYGNIVIGTGAKLRVESRNPAGAANSFVEHTLSVYGNLSNNGTLDLRGGSTTGGTSVGVLTVFTGSGNSTIALMQTTYQASLEEFNGIKINKSGNAKVILSSGNLFMNSSSTVGPSVLTFINGVIETGSNIWITTATGSASVTGASSVSYVNGNMGRGMNSSSEAEKKFDIGDAATYRPISIRTTYGGRASGHYVYASIVNGNANTGSSSYSGAIDSVSSVRYYKIGYSRGGVALAADTMTFKQFTPTYYSDDDFTQSSLGLHVAYSTNGRSTWNDAGPTNHVTDLSLPPTEIQCTAITPEPLLRDNGTIYVALAHGSGTPTGPIADSTNARYGNANLQRYDLWKATSGSPTPLLIYIHGGGLTSGSKSDISTTLVTRLLEKGISVMSINYRLSPEVVTPQHFLDCSRAIQYARYYASQLNIDPERIALGGSSAGALTSFWLGYHDDLADAESSDPVLRKSTRVTALVCWSGQTSVDNRVVGGWIDPIVLDFSSYFRGTIFGIHADSMNTPTAHARMEEASPYEYVTAGDPPTWMYYTYVNTPTTSSEAIHHVGFGNHLKTKMDGLGLTAVVLTPSYTGSITDSSVNFLAHYFSQTPLSVELTSFTADASERSAQLVWMTASESWNHGFEIERRSMSDATVNIGAWVTAGFVTGSGNSSTPHCYTFEDKGLPVGLYEYRLKQIDTDGSFRYVGGIEAVEIGRVTPKFELSESFPNPFNPSTTIEFSVAKEGTASLTVYDMLGQNVVVLFNGRAAAGRINRVQFDARHLAAGIYFSVLRSGPHQMVKKMLLVK